MKFLGMAANYSTRDVFRHLFARGSADDSEKLKKALAKRYGSSTSRVILYHTGRSALAAAIEAVVAKGSKILVATPTCIAVVRAVRAAGCEPVYVDSEPGNVQFGVAELEAAFTRAGGAAAVIVQNTLGIPVKMHLVEKFCKQHDIIIIEDLAHSAGRFYPDGREVGTVGTAVALSFGKGKALDTISGGALIVRDRNAKMPNLPALSPRRAERWRDRWYPFLAWLARGLWHIKIGKAILAMAVKFHWIERSADARLDLDVKLPDWQAKLVYKQLGELPRTVPKALNVAENGVLANPPLRRWAAVRNRAQVLQALEQKGYHFQEIWYDTPVSPVRYQKEAAVNKQDIPHTMKLTQQIVNLPTYYPETDLSAAQKIIENYEVKL